jgi:Uma2 family endonuclease
MAPFMLTKKLVSSGLHLYDCRMSAEPAPDTRMTVDEFLTWASDQLGRYELLNGIVHPMTPERAAHAERKAAIYTALLNEIRSRRLPCHVLPDGMTVRIDSATAYEPDAVVYGGSKLPPSALEVLNPVIVVEVVSPSSRQTDLSLKLAGYFRLPSVVHYLIVDPSEPLIIHHARGRDDLIATRIVREGAITLDPPGLVLNLSDVYGATQT